MARLVVDGVERAVAVERATTRAARRRGLLGRATFGGVLVLAPCRQVHTFGMRFPIEVAFCGVRGGEWTVLRLVTLAPRRISRPVGRAHVVLEAAAGTLTRLGLRPGVAVTVREHAQHER